MMISFNGFALVINIIRLFFIAFGRLNVGIAFGGQDPLSTLNDEGLSFCNIYIINIY